MDRGQVFKLFQETVDSALGNELKNGRILVEIPITDGGIRQYKAQVVEDITIDRPERIVRRK